MPLNLRIFNIRTYDLLYIIASVYMAAVVTCLESYCMCNYVIISMSFFAIKYFGNLLFMIILK